MNELLAFRDLHVGYGKNAESVLRDVDLVIERGELLGLVGPNGAGKSTLLRAVTGDADVHAGSIELAGRPLGSYTPKDRARIVGVVPQQVVAAFSFPAAEFVEMGRHPHLPRFSAPSQVDREIVQRAMRLTDTEHLAKQPVDALSGGDLQRLALAQALAQEPSVLLLDEPTSHLDLNHRLQVLDLVRDLVAQGMGVLAVFHDLDLAARYADRISVIADRGASPAAPPPDVIDAEMLRSVFGVRAVVGTDAVTGAVSVTPVLREDAVASRRRGGVLVVGGSGVAAPLLRRLVLDGWSVTSAAINAGDTDAQVADALGIAYAPLPPFAPMDEAATRTVQVLASDADVIVVCEIPFGHGNVGNLEIVVRSARPLVLVGDIAGRDYTGGRAETLWAEALAAGATVVASATGVPSALADL